VDKWLDNPGYDLRRHQHEKEREDLIRLLYESNPKNKKK